MSIKKEHYVGLDKWRFFAFLLVFWQHINHLIFQNIYKISFLNNVNIESIEYTGGIGVQFFFVLSGFLITFLLVREHGLKEKINLKKFYLRRILRIWPLYYLIMFIGIFILPKILSDYHFTGDVFKSLIFLNNLDVQNQTMLTGIAWSVAIEEQFYLLWPIIFMFFYRRKLIFIAVIIALISIIYNLLNGVNVYFSTLGNTIYLMVGCIGALSFNKFRNWFNFLNNKIVIRLLTFILILFFLFRLKFSLIQILILPILFLLFIINEVLKNDNKKSSLFSNLGKYTYGMYLYHPLVIFIVKTIMDKFLMNYNHDLYFNFLLIVLSLMSTIIVSIISYNFFERPFLNLKSRFE